jgi:predicted enzyme related to lactoylglutathione lyase
MIFPCTDAFVALAGVDFEQLVNFYQQLLHQTPQPYLPDVYAEFHLPNLRLGIFRPQEKHQSEFPNSVKSGISLCLEVSDLEQAIAHFTALGYPPPGQLLTASHGREIYAYDPAGNRLILHQAHSIPQTSLNE